MKARCSPWPVKEGDRVLFGKYAGTEIKLDGEDFLIMKEDEVLGILSGAAKREDRRITQVVVGRSSWAVGLKPAP